MKTNVKKLMMIFAAVAMTACKGTDMYDETFVENNQKASYAENFAKKYPNIDLNQKWDFSHKGLTYSMGENNSNNVRTRAGSGSWSRESWYEIDNSTVAWMQSMLTEGENHTSLGEPFYMTIPGNDFYIVPIYQGGASAVWDLFVNIDGVDYQIWGKSEDIQIKDLTNTEWHNCWEVKTYQWGGDGTEWESLFNTDGSDRWLDPSGARNKVTDIRAIPRKFSGFPVGANMYLYLKIRKGDEGRCNVGDEQSSLNGMMLALQDVPRPANIPSDYETMIIGCEDANQSLSDWDMNDVVFLVYGKSVPKPIRVERGEEVYESQTVRYMIEDLGATDDFDFNDIVIDMVEYTPKTPVYTNGVLTGWERGEKKQKAIIRHLGGTLPFTLTIGNTTLPELGGQGSFKTSPNLEFPVTGWDMNNHNLSVEVMQNTNSTVYNHVRFPKAGEAPMIIAVDPDQNWMPERQSVPESWFTTPDAQ